MHIFKLLMWCILYRETAAGAWPVFINLFAFASVIAAAWPNKPPPLRDFFSLSTLPFSSAAGWAHLQRSHSPWIQQLSSKPFEWKWVASVHRPSEWGGEVSPPHRHPAAAFFLLSVHRIQVGLGSPAGARSMACPDARAPPPLPCTLPLNANRPGRFKLTCRASRFQPSQQQRKTRKVRCPLPMPSPRAHFKFRNN